MAADCLWALRYTTGEDDNTAPAFTGALLLAEMWWEQKQTLKFLRSLAESMSRR